MKGKIKFIHAADIHLGSFPHYSENYPSNIKNIVDNSLHRAWGNLVGYCCENDVDFLLLSGDILDSNQRSIKALETFINGCQKLNDYNIQVYMITGNHDNNTNFDDIMELPDNLNIFSSKTPELKQYYFKGEKVVNLIGQSYSGVQERNPIFKNYIFPKNGLLNIALLHTQLENNNSKYVPASKKELKAIEEVDYWALGHIHQTKIINSQKPVIVFPGNIQGRDFGEKLQGGALLVEFNNKNLSDISFLALSDTIYFDVNINIDGKEIKNLNQLLDLMIKKLEISFDNMDFAPVFFKNNYQANQIKVVFLRWIIEGRGEITNILEEDSEEVLGYLKDKLNNRLKNHKYYFLTEEIINLTENIFKNKYTDKKIRESEIFDEIKKIKNNLLNKRNSEKISEKMGEIWQINSNHDPHYFEIDEDLIKKLINKAENKIIRALFEGED